MAKMQGKRLVISGTTELHERVSTTVFPVKQYAEPTDCKAGSSTSINP